MFSFIPFKKNLDKVDWSIKEPMRQKKNKFKQIFFSTSDDKRTFIKRKYWLKTYEIIDDIIWRLALA